jgi:hypothetical protein
MTGERWITVSPVQSPDALRGPDAPAFALRRPNACDQSNAASSIVACGLAARVVRWAMVAPGSTRVFLLRRRLITAAPLSRRLRASALKPPMRRFEVTISDDFEILITRTCVRSAERPQRTKRSFNSSKPTAGFTPNCYPKAQHQRIRESRWRRSPKHDGARYVRRRVQYLLRSLPPVGRHLETLADAKRSSPQNQWGRPYGKRDAMLGVASLS